MKKILITIMQIVDFFYPKDKNIVIVGSSNGRGIVGNSKVFGKYLEDKGYKIYYNWNNPPEGDQNICHSNIKHWPIFLSCKTVITTHSVSDLGRWQMILKNNRTFVELWHGIPLKSMGLLLDDATEKDRRHDKKVLKRVKVWSVTSELFKQLYKSMYPLKESVFQVLGSPRNDQYESQEVNFKDYIPDLPEYNKIILYAPTWREKQKDSVFFPFPEQDIKNIVKYLEDNKIIILLRGHIDEKSSKSFSTPYIKEFGNDIVFDIDSVISGFDSIITDYSSIYFDFLFFNRPICFIPYDLDEYIKTRGLLFEYDSITPGEKVKTSQDLIRFFEDLKKDNDPYKDKRDFVFNLVYKYKDYNSCDRVYKYLIDNKLLKEV